MEICVLNPYFYPYKGGTEKVLLEVYGRLAKRHNITVLTSTVPGRNEERREEIRRHKCDKAEDQAVRTSRAFPCPSSHSGT